MKKLTAILIMLALLLVGCHSQISSPNGTQAYVPPEKETEPMVEYGWTDGVSPVPNKRIGLVRAGVNCVYHAVGPTGVYFLDIVDESNSFIVYADDGSDTFIKLCGRPDCNHNTADCNAYVPSGCALSYFGGYLFVGTGGSSLSHEAKLIRMDPDGSDHVTVMDLNKFAKENGGDFAICNMITDGFCLFTVFGWEITSQGPDHTEQKTTSKGKYYYKLDGSMKAPERANIDGLACYNCADVFLVHNPTPVEGSEYGCYYDWNPDTNSASFLTPHPGKPGWYGEDEGYYFKDGYICRLTYDTNKEELMVDTELEGSYLLTAFPDCLVLVSNDSKATDNNLYVYNWSFELIDTVRVPNPNSQRTNSLMIAETAERLFLTTSFDEIPTSYINKSELGSGNVKIYPFHFQ